MGWGLWGWEAPAELAAVPGVEAAPGYEGVGKGSGMGRWVDGAAPQRSLWGGRGIPAVFFSVTTASGSAAQKEGIFWILLRFRDLWMDVGFTQLPSIVGEHEEGDKMPLAQSSKYRLQAL